MKVLEFVAYARKFVIALAAALGVLTVALGDGTVNLDEWLQIGIAFAGALGVYAVTNEKK